MTDRIIFESSRLPLPPLTEQRRIAEVLDRAEALRAKRRAALAQLDTLTQSIFLDLFGDPATNPKGLTARRSAITTCFRCLPNGLARWAECFRSNGRMFITRLRCAGE